MYQLKKIYKIENNKIRGVILNFFLEKPWDQNSEYYDEWESNLEKAKEINLKKRKKPIKRYNNEEIKEYFNYIK